jgi:hypothetical protein
MNERVRFSLCVFFFNEEFLVDHRGVCGLLLECVVDGFLFVTVFLVSVAKARDTSPVYGSMWSY